MRNYGLIVLVVMTATLLTACKKEAGKGGKNSISGTVYYNLTDHNGKVIAKEKAVDVDVFITYGDNTFNDDDVATNQDGSYVFNFLRKGDYTIHAYEDCNTCDSDMGRVEVSANVAGKKDELVAPDIELVEDVGPDDGDATITGKVFVKEYNALNQQIDQYYGQNIEVYIIYDTDSTYFENNDTNGDGRFTFTNLIPGAYTIYTYSECWNCGQQGTEVKQLTTTITDAQQSVGLPDLVIEER